MRSVVFVGLMVLVVLVAGCSSDDDATTTTEGDTTTTVPAIIDAEEMCRTLGLLEAAGAPPAQAAGSMNSTDLEAVSSRQRADYGGVLVSAPRALCPDLTEYADEVAYWLGF